MISRVLFRIQNILPFWVFVQLRPSQPEWLRGSVQSANIYIPSVPVIKTNTTASQRGTKEPANTLCNSQESHPQTFIQQDWRPAAPPRFRTRLEGGQFVLLRQGQEVLAEGQEVLTAAVAEAGTEIMPLCKQAKWPLPERRVQRLASRALAPTQPQTPQARGGGLGGGTGGGMEEEGGAMRRVTSAHHRLPSTPLSWLWTSPCRGNVATTPDFMTSPIKSQDFSLPHSERGRCGRGTLVSTPMATHTHTQRASLSPLS